jgi:hypothetical protein
LKPLLNPTTGPLFFKLLSFSSLSQWIILDKGYLFRQDQCRLVAHRIDFSHEKPLYFSFSAFTEVEDPCQIYLDAQSQLCVENTAGEKVFLKPEDSVIDSSIIHLLSHPEFNFEFKIESKMISRQLSKLQRLLHKENLDVEKTNLCIDIENRNIFIENMATEKEDFNCVFQNQLKPPFLKVSFSYAKEFFGNAQRWQEEIHCKTWDPYCTQINLNSDCIALFNHKRIS